MFGASRQRVVRRHALGRQNEKKGSTIILIMQRLHEDDLVGHVLEQEDWESVTFPAIAEQDASYMSSIRRGARRRFTRKAGEVLHPEREPLAMLDRIRAQIGEYHFAGQYQQTPTPLGGGMVKGEWFVPYREGNLPIFEQDRAELGHGEQGGRAQRLQRLHDLGPLRQAPLFARRL